jgi:hypothetical protein
MNFLAIPYVSLDRERMGTRLISKVRPKAINGNDDIPGRGRRGTVVIADSGFEAEVLVFPPGQLVRCGAEFDYRGMTWMVTAERRDSGVLVAEPVAH